MGHVGMDDRSLAGRVLQLLDLTSLGDGDDESVVERLCRRATTAHGDVAAVCVWPRFVAQCRRQSPGSRVRIASVANFPDGGEDIAKAVQDTRYIVSEGGDEVDLVMPYRAWLAGRHTLTADLIAACREACGAGVGLKVILETGVLGSDANIAAASRQAIGAGATFIKTSTGKTAVSATPGAAAVMLEAIRDNGVGVGFKAAGGIADHRQAGGYLQLADRIMGAAWATPGTFRFGASGLLDDLLAVLEQRAPESHNGGY